MLKTTKNRFIESFIGSNNKVDHKRLTVFSFVIAFFITTAIVLFKKNQIPNSELVEVIIITMTSVILGGMGLTKIKTKTKDVNNETK